MPKEANKKQDNKKQNKKSFGKDFKAELKRVIWPTPKQLFNNTVAVITVVLITAAIVFALDFVFESINTYGINKLKQTVNANDSENINSISLNNLNNETTVSNQTEETVTENSNSVEE